MIRRFDRFYAKHPRIAFSVMVCALVAVLAVAWQADASNTTMLRRELAAQSRSST